MPTTDTVHTVPIPPTMNSELPSKPRHTSPILAKPAPPTDPKSRSPSPTPTSSVALLIPREDEPAQPPEEVEEDVNSDVDMETFQQILDLDDDTHEFSKGMAWAYFSQAEDTFKEMDGALKEKNLAQLSSLGHFLKGSSAALGLSKVQASCEKIQHYGQKRDEEAEKDLSDTDALRLIEELLGQVKQEYTAAEAWLKQWYIDHPDPEPEPAEEP